MEKVAAWFDMQVEIERTKRQERSNRGQTLAMLRQTTSVPNAELSGYLAAYVSLCGTEPRVWNNRKVILAKRFNRPWWELRCDMSRSVAEPKRRSEKELNEALKSFQLAYKEACEDKFQKNPRRHSMNSFIKDVFGSKEQFMAYLRYGADRG